MSNFFPHVHSTPTFRSNAKFADRLRGSVGTAALLALGFTVGVPMAARAQQSGATAGTGGSQIQVVTVVAQRLLKRDKDVASAITEITPTQIAAQGITMGSIQTLLKQTPSVNAYTQGPGQTAPTLSIRGERAGELSETLDGVPLTDLLAGQSGASGNYLSNNVGSAIVLSQISGVNVYAGVAPPDKQGFGTVGGTVAYSLVKPTDKPYVELEGGVGSFSTYHGGININTGRIGGDADALKALLQYDQSETAGYVQNTYSQYKNILFSIDKPYDDALSDVRFTLIDNTGRGNVQTQPTPTALIKSNGLNYNFPNNIGYYNQSGNFRGGRRNPDGGISGLSA